MTAKPLLSARDLRVTFDLPAPGGMPWSKPRQLQSRPHQNQTVRFALAATMPR